jgi:hypothetical protein
MSIKGRYPLSTREGGAIPFDILSPHSLQIVNFAASTPSAWIDVPEGVELCVLRATAPCFVQYGVGTEVDVDVARDGTVFPNVLNVHMDTYYNIVPSYTKFRILPFNLAGSIIIQNVLTWSGVGSLTYMQNI